MIYFFRKLRHKIISEGKVKKYILYAFGETMLVVIGILIAVQINKLVNLRQRNALEIKILQEIRSNLEDDLIDIQNEIRSFEFTHQADSILIYHTKNKQEFPDSIGLYAYIFELNPHFTPQKSGYELLTTNGIDLITGDALRIRLTNTYERSYIYYKEYADERIQIAQTLFIPYMTRNFYLENYHEWPYYKRIPFDYQKLKGDPEWISLIQTSSELASKMIEKAITLKKEIETLKKQIDLYLINKTTTNKMQI